MNKHLIVSGIIVLLICVGLSGCVYPSQGICANKLDEIPDNFVNMSEQQMDEFPHLKEAVISQECFDTPKEEFNALTDLLDTTATGFIKYKDEYYEIWFVYGD